MKQQVQKIRPVKNFVDNSNFTRVTMPNIARVAVLLFILQCIYFVEGQVPEPLLPVALPPF